jgi:hypothetical protein
VLNNEQIEPKINDVSNYVQTEPILSSVEYNGEIQYGSINSSYRVYSDANELVERADVVITGTISNISFEVIDPRTGFPPAEDAIEKYAVEFGFEPEPWRIFVLETIYDVDIITTYKGEKTETVQVRMRGGLQNYRIDEQIAISRKYGIDFILISENNENMKIGETYLVALSQLPSGNFSPINPGQGSFKLGNPFEKQASWGERFDISYYSRSRDEFENPLISAYDVISTFGDNVWDTFWTQWQQENSDWETRINKSAVEKILNTRQHTAKRII